MESLKGKTFNEYVYYIICNQQSGKLSSKHLQVKLERELTEDEIWGGINYARDLRQDYCSSYEWVPKDLRKNKYIKDERIKAIAFNDTIKRLREEYGERLVAYSHRYGGWHRIEWTYNEEISFHINTNFGYGSAGYFSICYYYKDTQLAPYSDYILYRYAGYYDIVRYTYSYPCEYRYWTNLMEETIKFFNAVLDVQEHKVFDWIKGHLNRLVSGLRNLLTSNAFYFHDGNGGKWRSIKSIQITGEDLIFLKAEKIGGAVKFVENINGLPMNINPKYYIDQLNNIFRDFLTWVQPQIKSYHKSLKKLMKEKKEIHSRPIVKTYHQLLKNEELKNYEISIYYESKITLIRKLRAWLMLRDEKYPYLSNEEIKEMLVKPLKELNEVASSLRHIEDKIKILTESQSKVEEYLLSINSD